MAKLGGVGAVVTGGGHGIGRAIARGLAGVGARVVVNDIDAAAAASVAEEIGGIACPGDAAADDGVDDLISSATAHLGAVDVYCANAGVAGGAGLDASEADWAYTWEVNVMAHVRAARRLVPQWLDRGSGRFVATASAAGLLTMLGAAPYSVTKHAAVAHAEWLAATFGDRGVAVHCICPQGVRTRMLEESGAAGETVLQATAIEPEQVAAALLAAIDEDRFLVLPHPEVARFYAARATDTDRWLAGMRRIQRRIEPLPE